MTVLRVGQGYDVHRFADDDRPMVLGGVRMEGERGLLGHSDADAVAHAVTDALLAAAGLGDIGQHFPDTDPRWKGADSMDMLARVVAMLRERRCTVGNVDCTVVCERPRIAPHRDEMQRRLTEVVGAPVTVKGRRAEGLGAIGRGEGVMCTAVALVDVP
ncbi:MAG: 2-C-methyl-D-erythritol 2,4-cyclodiphosphate synthase [Actinobacteria bacterium]|nr:2-C-methyl-D-erythritol 2,4-cyclodiphosphate synthase [Actinomycetota bacterium]